MPSAMPPAAGSPGASPCACALSMAGMSSDQIVAASMTPAAKPRQTRWALAEGARRCGEIKKTTAAPSAVIPKVKPVPSAAHVSAFMSIYLPCIGYAGTGVRVRSKTSGNRWGSGSRPLDFG